MKIKNQSGLLSGKNGFVAPPAQAQRAGQMEEQQIKKLEEKGNLPPAVKAVCEMKHTLKKYIVY